MIVEVDTSSPVPPFEQIRNQISSLVASGTLRTGARLPPIRQLAHDLGVAAGTVARAYRELEAEGVVASRVRHGTTVLARASLDDAERQSRLDEAARQFATAVRPLGIPAPDAIQAVQQALTRSD